MDRYVSIDEIDKIYRKLGCSENEIEIAHMIEDLPTVDAVEVVRCKDCKHYEEICTGYGYCYRWDYEDGSSPNQVDADDFCSRGCKDGRG